MHPVHQPSRRPKLENHVVRRKSCHKNMTFCIFPRKWVMLLKTSHLCIYVTLQGRSCLTSRMGSLPYFFVQIKAPDFTWEKGQIQIGHLTF